MRNEFRVELNPTQWSVIRSNYKENHLIGGLGMGKSFTIGIFIYTNCSVKGSLGLLAAPTYDVLRDSTLPQVLECFDKLGLIDGVDYVISTAPPKSWNIKPYSKLNNKNVITFRWGSYLILGSMNKPNRWRGVELDYVAVDEFRDVKEWARDLLLGRLRGRTFKALDRQYKILFATTPPDNPAYLLNLIEENEEKKTIGFHFGTTYENADNLPKGYADELKESLDDRTYEREVLGLLKRYSSNLFAWAFSEERHIEEGMKIDKKLPIWLSFDFNVNPMTCLLIQHSTYEVRVLMEFKQESSNIFKLLDEIKPYLSEHQNRIKVTGDPSGNNSDPAKRENETMYWEIRNGLKLSKDDFFVLMSHPLHKNSQVLVNSILQRLPVFKINKNLKGLRKDLTEVQMLKETDSIDKSDLNLTHLLDCLRYFLHVQFGNFVKLKKYQTPNKYKKIN